MYGIENVLEESEKSLRSAFDGMVSSPLGISTEDMRAIVAYQQSMNAECERITARYAKSDSWAVDGYLSAKTAVVHETQISRRTADISLAKGALLHRYPHILEAVRNHAITDDHVGYMVSLGSEKYCEFFDDDVELLVHNAMNVSADQFSRVVHHWKNMVDALIDEPSDEYVHFQNRKLFLNEIMDGRWIISGELDSVTGKILDKTLKDISEKLWRNSSPEFRSEYTPAMQRADAIGYLAQGYLSAENTAICPDTSSDISPDDTSRVESILRFNPASVLTTDVVLDISELNPETTTHEFLRKSLISPSPLINTHAPATIEQILCDTNVHIPIKKNDGTYDLGRNARTAPLAMKKQLMMGQSTCSIPGCSTPSAWCDAHHIVHWAHGGETKMDNLALLCRRHHTMLHHDKTFAEKVGQFLKTDHPTDHEAESPPHAHTG